MGTHHKKILQNTETPPAEPPPPRYQGRIGAQRDAQGKIINYDQQGNQIIGYDGSVPWIRGADGRAQASPQSRSVGATPYAKPQNNKGESGVFNQLRAQWGWGAPEDAGDEIRAKWEQKYNPQSPASPQPGQDAANPKPFGSAALDPRSGTTIPGGAGTIPSGNPPADKPASGIAPGTQGTARSTGTAPVTPAQGAPGQPAAPTFMDPVAPKPAQRAPGAAVDFTAPASSAAGMAAGAASPGDTGNRPASPTLNTPPQDSSVGTQRNPDRAYIIT